MTIGKSTRTFLEVLGFLVIYYLLSLVEYPPIVSILGGLMFFMYLSYFIYTKVKYRKRDHPNEILFPTQNDVAHKYTLLSIGILFIAFSIVYAFVTQKINLSAIIFTVLGLLLFLNGFFYLSSGKISVKENQISNGKSDADVEIATVESVLIQDDNLTFDIKQRDKIIHDNLELSSTDKLRIKEFLEDKISNISIRLR